MYWKISYALGLFILTHCGRVSHICVSKLTIIGSDNGLSPDRRQAIIWTKAGILLIGPLGTNFSGNLFEYHTYSLKKMHLKMSSGKWRPFYLGLDVLIPPLMWPHISIPVMSAAGDVTLPLVSKWSYRHSVRTNRKWTSFLTFWPLYAILIESHMFSFKTCI